jgi:pimeloyl-ACP methyl ester carboxylesterase
MPRNKVRAKPAPPRSPSAFDRAWDELRAPTEPPPTVSARWLLTAIGVAILAAAACAWGALCLLFWQGSWQLLYHPAAAVTRTPASMGLAFDAVGFAVTEAGEPRLRGWWVPAGPQAGLARFTVLYLHGRDGNLGDTVDALAALHEVGVNVFAIDYRGYGQSQFARPSEAHWREDAESAIAYLTATRHIAAGSIVLDGEGLGANLALGVAARHPELNGVALREPLDTPVNAIFNDPRARLVPARLLVRDRFDLSAPAAELRIPSLWLFEDVPGGRPRGAEEQLVFERVSARKELVRVANSPEESKQLAGALARWLGNLRP